MYRRTMTSAMMLRRYRMGFPGIGRTAQCLIFSRDPGDAKEVFQGVMMIYFNYLYGWHNGEGLYGIDTKSRNTRSFN